MITSTNWVPLQVPKAEKEKQYCYYQGCRVRVPELDILPGAGAQIKNQEPELKLKIRSWSLV